MLTRRFIGVLLIIFSFSREVQADDAAAGDKKGYYTIVTPGTLRSQSLFHVSISLSDFHQSCFFKLILQKIDTHESIHEFKNIEVHPNTTKLFQLRAPTLEDKLGHLRIIVSGGIFNIDSAAIRFETNSISTFIQTNKAKYKPGELVQFRVICIDQLTRPAKVNQSILISIYDGQENVIKHISDVELVQGVFKGEFQLFNYPVLGEWKIKIQIGGDDAAEKFFQVARYSLPRFLVSIETKPNVVIDEKKIVLEISARYFYGEPVRGNLTILLNNTYAAFQDRIPILKRQSQIHEKTTLVFDMKDDLHIENKNESGRPVILFKFKAEAVVIDDLSGQMSKAEIEIAFHSKPFKIKLQAPKVFDGDKFLDLKVKAFATDLEDRPVQNNKTNLKIVLECHRPSGFDIEPFKSEYKHSLGIESKTIKVANQNFSECSLYAEYEGCKSPKELIRKTQDLLQMSIITESPEVGKELVVNLKRNGPIGNFSYEIVSRGDIIEAQQIKVPENRTTFLLSLNLTYAMVPKITIYVHSIDKFLFEGQLKDVYIKRAFENSIQITTNEETKPGAPLYINVTTDEGSYVGLMGLDQRILQNSNKGDDLTEKNLYTRLRTYDPLTIDSRSYPGAQAGLVTFSNAISDPDDISIRIDGETILADSDYKLPDEFDKPTLELPRIRELFSDSWLYKDFERTPAGGFNFMETVPDTITSWAITGFSLNPNTGLTLTRNATNFKVFQEFFVSMDLPSLVKEGETIEVPVYISNYMSQDAQTNVAIESDSKDLNILEHPETVSKQFHGLKLIPASKNEKITFFIKPRKPGQFNVTVKAISPAASDAIKKTLHVGYEGVPYEISKTSLIHFPEESNQEDEIKFDIPANVVPGSQSIEISVVGDIFRPLMKSLEKLARFPSGNSEDNMRIIISNVLALNYLKALNYSNPSLEKNIKLHIESGCQDQLSFKQLDGSFALFYNSNERTGDIWQTALALWGLKQAGDFIQVDLEVFRRGWKYLQAKQLANGCFKSEKGIEDDVKYTSLALMVFLMDEDSKKNYRRVITKGLAYLYNVSVKLRRSSISFMAAYVLGLGEHEKAADCLEKLTSSAALTSKQMNWTKSDNLPARLEMTAGSLMNLFSSQKHPKQDLLHIVRGLITPEEEQSSLTHMLALKAMTVFVEELHLKNINLNISFKDDKKVSGSFELTSENSQVLQTFKLSPKSRKVNLRSKGFGFGVVDVKIKYKIVPEIQTTGTYHTSITTRSISNDLNGLKICLSVLNNGSLSELTIMEVNLQSGYIFTESAPGNVEETNEVIKSVEVSSGQDKVVIYFENVDSNGSCLNLEALKTYKVFNAKPGWIIVYDAHKNDQKTAKSFKIEDN